MNPRAVQEISDYEHHLIHDRLDYFKPRSAASRQTFAQQVRSGLGGTPKSLSPKFFYDCRGSSLFEQICRLPEYYLTRTEIKILGGLGDELAPYIAADTRLVELGSGSSVKTRLILDVFERIQGRTEYFPIDVSDILEDSSRRLLGDYANLHVTGIIDTYDRGLEFVRNFDDAPNLIAFLGSSFGNFSAGEGGAFLRLLNSSMGDSDHFLVGLDLLKDARLLEDAYDDSRGVTAKFNLNVLSRINGELGGNFDLGKFSHHIVFNRDMQRIEMYLRSKEAQSARIPKSDLEVHLYENELIHTEHSHKYTVPQIRRMLGDSGFAIDRIWRDDMAHYALVLCSKA